MPVTGKRSINHINKLTGCLKEKKCALSLDLALWFVTVRFEQYRLHIECVCAWECVCMYQVEGCLEMTALCTSVVVLNIWEALQE